MFNMGAVKAFDVFLDDELEVYHIGEAMKGRVVVSLTKDLAMKGKNNPPVYNHNCLLSGKQAYGVI